MRPAVHRRTTYHACEGEGLALKSHLCTKKLTRQSARTIQRFHGDVHVQANKATSTTRSVTTSPRRTEYWEIVLFSTSHFRISDKSLTLELFSLRNWRFPHRRVFLMKVTSANATFRAALSSVFPIWAMAGPVLAWLYESSL